MEPIQLTIDERDLKAQLDFLIRLEFSFVFQKYRYHGLYLVALTLFIVLLSIFSDNSNYLALKGVSIVMLALFWIFTVGYLIVLLIRYQNRQRWKRRQIKPYLSHDPTELYFDSELISYESSKYKTSLKWSYFAYYKEHKTSIFIFDERNIYQALYFSVREIGADNYQTLKDIVAAKLKPLPWTIF